MSSTERSTIDIKLKNVDKIFRPNDIVEGRVFVDAFKGWQHNGVKMFVDGSVFLVSPSTSVGLLDAVGNPASRDIPLIREEFQVTGPGTFVGGRTEIPFEFPLRSSVNRQGLIESYHGVFISVIYSIAVECDRGIIKKPLQKKIEFFVEAPVDAIPDAIPTVFDITPENLENVKSHELNNIPKFRVTGKLHRSNCIINRPFEGDLIIKKSEAIIKSIELQLVRVETVTLDSSSANAVREATEIQNIQIADGNVCRDVVIPMHMIFPKRFACVTVLSKTFKIEFEMTLMVVFSDGYMVTENFPIVLLRSKE